MGSAAVGIRGTTLLKSWNIPVFEKGQQVRYKKWNDDEKRALKRMFGQNIDSICAVIIDEVSTIQPYMLAYLSIRMVILLGDFDQKSPTAGGKSGTLPEVVMKYISKKVHHQRRSQLDARTSSDGRLSIYKISLH